MASDFLTLSRPRIGYARLVSARNTSNQSQGMDIKKVIILGHTLKQPLIQASGELVDGLEPTAIWTTPAGYLHAVRTLSVGEGCTRGGAAWVVQEGTIPGTHPASPRPD